MTAAINVANDKSEREIDRKLKAYSPQNKVNYDLVTLEGKLKFRNYREAAGRDRGQQSRHRQALERRLGRHAGRRFQQTPFARPRRECTLEDTDRAGKEKTLTYQYERYVPSN